MDTTASDELVGRLLERRYRVDALIARGGMATVYEATDIRLERRVALKVMRRSLADDEAFTHRLAREARASANLAHPNIVGVYDHGEDQGVLFLAMEFVPGRKTLRDVVRAEAPLPPGRALAIVDQILQGIEVAHEAGIIHRDIKPENVLLNPRGQVKVADFGLARAVTSAATVTATSGALMGTVAYLPPELVTEGRADARSDVYALGVMTYELLTGQKPHEGENPMQIAYAHVHHDVAPPSRLVPGLPDYVDAFVARTTARDRDQRPADAHVMRHQLGRVRHALDRGVTGDEELTSDLEPTTALYHQRRRSWQDDVPGLVVPDVDDTTTSDGGWYDDASGGDVTIPVPSQLDDHPDVVPTHLVPVIPPPDADAPDEPTSKDWTSDDDWAPADDWATDDDWTSAESTPPPPDRPVPVSRQPYRPRRTRGLVVLAVVLVLAALAAFAGWWLSAGRYSSTPDVTGLEQQRARQTLARDGYAVRLGQPVFSEQVRRGTVVTTEPEPSAKVLPGSEVTLVLSRGPERYAVPQLSGLPVDRARDALQNNHLSPGVITWRWSEQVPRSRVIRFAPRAGRRVRPDTRVDIVASKGRRPIPVTSFVGSSAARATSSLEGKNLRVTTSRRYDDEVPEGDVIAQTPSQGTLHRGDTVALVVSRGPHLVEVPSVQSDNADSAEEELRAAGFVVERQTASVDFGLNIVVDQSPGGGDMAPYRSTVTITVT